MKLGKQLVISGIYLFEGLGKKPQLQRINQIIGRNKNTDAARFGKIVFIHIGIFANNESYSIFTVKGSIPQMKLAFQGINNHNASDLDNDGMLDVVTTPYDAEVNLSLSRKRIGGKGLLYLQDDNVVSAELMEASKLYHEEQFRKWIIRACLTLDAPLPTKVLNWLGNEWFGYRGSAILYYLDADGQLNRLDTYKRKLRHKVITKETTETELDSHAVRIASETNLPGQRRKVGDGNGNGNGDGDGGRKLQMDKKLNTWFFEAEGTKKAISCREIATQYDSYEKGIIKRLRAGIDSGADFSTVELN